MAELPEHKKGTHAAAGYEFPSEHMGQACGNCKHVLERGPHPSCEIVKDPIFLAGWCEWYKRKEGAANAKVS